MQKKVATLKHCIIWLAKCGPDFQIHAARCNPKKEAHLEGKKKWKNKEFSKIGTPPQTKSKNLVHYRAHSWDSSKPSTPPKDWTPSPAKIYVSHKSLMYKKLRDSPKPPTPPTSSKRVVKPWAGKKLRPRAWEDCTRKSIHLGTSHQHQPRLRNKHALPVIEGKSEEDSIFVGAWL